MKMISVRKYGLSLKTFKQYSNRQILPLEGDVVKLGIYLVGMGRLLD